MSRRDDAHPCRRSLRPALALAALCATAGCGGGNPLDNPSSVANPATLGGQKLSFAYFQRCVYPILVTDLPVLIGNAASTNNCAGSGCHDNTTGTGGSFRVIRGAAAPDLNDPTNTPEVVRATDMYKNFYSAQGAAIVGAVAQSRLLNKPLVNGVLHGGGLVFANLQDANAKVLQYWISNPSPRGQDEFSASNYSVYFSPANPTTGTCISQ
jgi:hypothetical protein